MRRKRRSIKLEDIKSKEVANILKNKIKNKLIQCSTQKHIFIGATAGIDDNGQTKLFLQSAKQDIVIHLNDTEDKYQLDFLDKQELIEIFDMSFPDKKFTVPLLIFEFKFKKSLNTQMTRQYSEQARMIKAIFPFCKFYLILMSSQSTSIAKRIYMASKHFDKVITVGSSPKEIADLLYKEFNQQYRYFKKDDYFGLKNLI